MMFGGEGAFTPWNGAGSFLGACLCVLACSPADVPHSPPFDQVFRLEEVVELAEDPSDSIAEIGQFLERQAGGFLISDALLPRVRSYSSEGSLEMAFGRFGEGPWEFRRIHGIAETASGQVVVASFRNPWLTYLGNDMIPDTLVPLPELAVQGVHRFQQDLILHGISNDAVATPAAREGAKRFHLLTDGRLEWSAWPDFVDKPYWGGLGGSPNLAVAGDSVFIMEPLRYPATVFNGAGDSVGTIGYPPPSFRYLPEIPRGYFATEQSGSRVRAVLESYDLVSRIDVVANDHLVFTIGRPDPTKASMPFRFLDTSVEVYDRQSGKKLYEEVTLPKGAKVLGGSKHLYILLNPDFPPWRIAKYRLTPDIAS